MYLKLTKNTSVLKTTVVLYIDNKSLVQNFGQLIITCKLECLEIVPQVIVQTLELSKKLVKIELFSEKFV